MIGPDNTIQSSSKITGARSGEAEGDIRSIAITRSVIVREILRRPDTRAEAGERANGTKLMATSVARSTTRKVEQRGTGVAATISGMVNKGLKVSDRNSQAR